MKVMRPHRHDLHGHKIVYPCYLQPKLNGVRCIVSKIHGEVSFRSRNDNLFPAVANNAALVRELTSLMHEGQTLDGELYVHGWSFQKIISAVKKVSHLTHCLQYHVFDTIADGTFEERKPALSEHWSVVEQVQTVVVPNEIIMRKWVDIFISKGYEGCILRNLTGLYVDGQSYDVQKVKKFVDAEFKIVSHTLCSKGGAIFTCECPGGEVSVKPMGSVAHRKRLADDMPNLLGKLLTVKYAGLSDDGILLMPIGMAVRDYE